MMTLDQFIQEYTGKPNVGDTPQNQGQCVGLVEVWLDNLGLEHIWGNADQLMANADPTKYDIIQNTPQDVPLAGDIVCWDSSWGNGAGHTGIFCSGDTSTMNIFQQNDPDGSTPHAKTYAYQGVMGWIHPKTAAPIAAPTQDTQTIINELRTARDQNWNLYQQEIQAVNTVTGELEQSKEQITALQGQVNDLQGKYETEQKENVALNAMLEKMANGNKDYAKGILDAQHERDAASAQVAKLKGDLGLAPTATLTDMETVIANLRKPQDDLVMLYERQLAEAWANLKKGKWNFTKWLSLGWHLLRKKVNL